MTSRRLIALAAGALAVLAAGTLVLDRVFPPPLDRLEPRHYAASVLDRDGEMLRRFASDTGRWRIAAQENAVDPFYLRALIAIEDSRFWYHLGVDPLAILRAGWQTVSQGRIVSGASTLTMQVARLLEPELDTRRPLGKLQQMVRALQLSARLSRGEILNAYLDLAPFGGNIEGVVAASEIWLGKTPRQLTPAEAALLIALPQAPEGRRPDVHLQTARAARDAILRRLFDDGLLSEERLRRALAEGMPESRRDAPQLAAHLAREVRPAAGGTMRTTLRRDKQLSVEGLARSLTDQLPKGSNLAILVVESGSGAIEASLGSLDLFDHARSGAIDFTDRIRSYGSTLKPLLYAMSFDGGLSTPMSPIDDRRRRFGAYAPHNFDTGFNGQLTAAEALRLSLNVPAVSLLQRLGPRRFISRLYAAGAMPALPEGAAPGLPVILGGGGVTLRQLVQLYTGFDNRGVAMPLHALPGDTVESGVRIVSAHAAAAIGRILTLPNAQGQGTALAIKTGTSSSSRDSWAIGFDGHHTIGVWVGRPDGAPMPGVTGASQSRTILEKVAARLPQPPRPPWWDAPDLAWSEPRLVRNVVRAKEQPLVIAFPPDGAVIHSGHGQAVPIKANGGYQPYDVVVQGRSLPAGRQASRWMPDGPGFYRITVVDRRGAAATAAVEIQ